MKIGAVILAGGQSRRMQGVPKASLTLGKTTFIEHLIQELSQFDELLISANQAGKYAEYGLPVIPDIHPDCGPLGGLLSALRACHCEYLMAVSCDMPLFSGKLAEYLCEFVSSDYDAWVTVSSDGKIHPLCGIYTKQAADYLEEQLHNQNYRLRDCLNRMRVKYISLSHSAYPDRLVMNVNTPQDYQALLRDVQGPAVIAISGVKNSGKTTLITGILPFLKKEGLRVAVIKHDGHDFIPDVPGTDSFRIRAAGACGVAIYSDHQYMITEETADLQISGLVKQFNKADLILLEGQKNSTFPKVEIVRAEISSGSVCNPDTLIGICTDLPALSDTIPCFGLNDYEQMAKLIIDYSAYNPAFMLS